MELERLLAHGRGAGWLAARERGRSGIELVLRCVLEDPRWDRQVESRDEYYASLLIALDADPRPILDALANVDPDEAWLARQVLIQLAWRGHADALAAVVERVRSGAETDEQLELVADLSFAARVYALADRTLEPAMPTPPRRSSELEPDLSLAELGALMIAAKDSRQLLAARRLGELDCAEHVGQAEAFLRSESSSSAHRQRLAWLRYLAALPAARTLGEARRWFHASEWPLRRAGEQILSEHADPEDRPMLEHAGALALAEREMYRLCSIIDALGRLGAPSSLDFLARVYCTIDYSYARERACDALLAHGDRPEVQTLLVESLWDCESGTRERACEGVEPRTATVRLRELAADPFERAEVRDAAREAMTDV